MKNGNIENLETKRIVAACDGILILAVLDPHISPAPAAPVLACSVSARVFCKSKCRGRSHHNL